jgi:hypothetical protein
VISLRTRLTLSYAVPLAGVLIVVFALGRIAFASLAQPVMFAVASSVRAAEATVASRPSTDRAALRRLVRDAAHQRGVVVMYPPNDAAPIGPGKPTPADVSDRFSLRQLLGVRPHRVLFPDGSDVLIAPDLVLLSKAISIYETAVGVGIVLAIGAAWLFARWLAGQAIAPLLTVTSELQRFGAGDFFGTGARSPAVFAGNG